MSGNLAKGLVLLMRPLNCIIAAFAVPAAFVFLTGAGRLYLFQKEILFSSLAVFLMCGAGNALNDFMDVRIDKINKPSRPIPSGMVARNEALVFSAVLFSSSVLVASRVSGIVFLSVLAGSMILVFYDVFSKSIGIFGNMLVSFVIGFPPIIMGLIVGDLSKAVFLAVGASAITLGRELVKNIEDVKGDSVVGRYSFTAKYGKRKAASLASVLIIIGSLSLVYLRSFYGNAYLVVLLLAIYKFSGAIIQPLRMTASKAGKLSKDIKIGSVIAVLALVVGSFLS